MMEIKQKLKETPPLVSSTPSLSTRGLRTTTHVVLHAATSAMSSSASFVVLRLPRSKAPSRASTSAVHAGERNPQHLACRRPSAATAPAAAGRATLMSAAGGVSGGGGGRRGELVTHQRRRLVMAAAAAKGGDAGAGDDDTVDDVASGYADTGPSISDIQELLDVAVREEDFEEAARLRDRLNALKVGDCEKRGRGSGRVSQRAHAPASSSTSVHFTFLFVPWTLSSLLSTQPPPNPSSFSAQPSTPTSDKQQ